MSAKQVTQKVVKTKRGDVEVKGKRKRTSKRTSIGKSRNSRPKNKAARREARGR